MVSQFLEVTIQRTELFSKLLNLFYIVPLMVIAANIENARHKLQFFRFFHVMDYHKMNELIAALVSPTSSIHPIPADCARQCALLHRSLLVEY